MLGSSPPVRGARENLASRVGENGLIPACAGSTPANRAWRCCGGAHPRLCGEHISRISRLKMNRGSSPPVRGAHETNLRDDLDKGLIPACAGSTPLTPATRMYCGAHPRLCGEHYGTYGSEMGRAGSSPPVRGAPGISVMVRLTQGLIPACAGSTCRIRS